MFFRQLIAAGSGIALFAVAPMAGASTTVSFTANVDEGEFTAPLSPPLDGRMMGFTGSLTFAANIVDGTYGLADLTDFTLELHRGIHLIGAPPGVLMTAEYNFSLSDLTALSLTFAGGVATAGSWTLNPLSPYSFSNAAFAPITSVDLDSSASSSLTYYQLVAGAKVAIARADFNRVTTTLSAVPEPASWALMIAGFAMVGAGLRHAGARGRPRFA